MLNFQVRIYICVWMTWRHSYFICKCKHLKIFSQSKLETEQKTFCYFVSCFQLFSRSLSSSIHFLCSHIRFLWGFFFYPSLVFLFNHIAIHLVFVLFSVLSLFFLVNHFIHAIFLFFSNPYLLIYFLLYNLVYLYLPALVFFFFFSFIYFFHLVSRIFLTSDTDFFSKYFCNIFFFFSTLFLTLYYFSIFCCPIKSVDQSLYLTLSDGCTQM